MTDRCPSGFDQNLLSGYLDGELRQGDEQRVRIHTEDCDHCRRVVAELGDLREATMSTRFATPTDQQWDEHPRTTASATARSLGWVMTIAWLVLTTGYGLWQAWQGTEDPVLRLIVFGGIAAVVILFLSVLIDRLRDARDDPYTEVKL